MTLGLGPGGGPPGPPGGPSNNPPNPLDLEVIQVVAVEVVVAVVVVVAAEVAVAAEAAVLQAKLWHSADNRDEIDEHKLNLQHKTLNKEQIQLWLQF